MAEDSITKTFLNNTILPVHVQALSPQEETRVVKARRILGETATVISDQDLQIFITELQYLINSWLDCYESEIFEGKTLRQVVHGD